MGCDSIYNRLLLTWSWQAKAQRSASWLSIYLHTMRLTLKAALQTLSGTA
jgi:hypothetical protein